MKSKLPIVSDCDVIYISDQNGDQTQVLAKLGQVLWLIAFASQTGTSKF